MKMRPKVQLRSMISASGYSVRECAALLGVNSRSFRLMLDENKPQVMPYAIQCGLRAITGHYKAGDIFNMQPGAGDTKGRRAPLEKLFPNSG